MCMCLKYGIKMKGLGETRADTGDEDSSHKGPGTFLLWGGVANYCTTAGSDTFCWCRQLFSWLRSPCEPCVQLCMAGGTDTGSNCPVLKGINSRAAYILFTFIWCSAFTTYTRANVVFTVQTHTINIVFPGRNCWYIIHMYLSQGCILCLIIVMLINGQSIPKLLVICLLGFSRRQNLSYVPSWLSAHVVQSSPVWRWLSLVSAALLIPGYHLCHHCIYATGNSNIVGRNPQIVCKG